MSRRGTCCADGQSAAAFVVLSAVIARRTDEGASLEDAVAVGGPTERAIAGLALMRDGSMSTALPVLRAAADNLDASGQHGAATAAYTLCAKVAACLGQVPVARRSLDRAGQLAAATRQPRFAARVELARALLAARAGEVSSDVVRDAMLGGRALERDRAELLHAVSLLAAECWSDAYDALVRLLERAATPPAELIG